MKVDSSRLWTRLKEKIIQWHYLALKCARIKVSRGKTMSDTLIRDNKDYGSVGEFLKDVVKEGSELSVVSAYFTIFAYYGLHE